MECSVPWPRLIAVIEPLHPKSGGVGRQPIGVPRCCACTACSSAMAWPARGWNMRCTTARRCAISSARNPVEPAI
jgi:hypothetical protein